MKRVYGYTVAGVCMLAFLGLALAACDGAETAANQSAANAASAEAQVDQQNNVPLARYNEGALTLEVSTGEARETVIESARRFIPNINAVTFEPPELKMLGNAPILMMRGKRPDGNCELVYLQLTTEEVLASGTVPAVHETPALAGRDVVLYPGRTQGCSGVNCSYCTPHSQGGCNCARSGGDDGASYCNHSCENC